MARACLFCSCRCHYGCLLRDTRGSARETGVIASISVAAPLLRLFGLLHSQHLLLVLRWHDDECPSSSFRFVHST
jgi:hypothetical protein